MCCNLKQTELFFNVVSCDRSIYSFCCKVIINKYMILFVYLKKKLNIVLRQYFVEPQLQLPIFWGFEQLETEMFAHFTAK